MIQTKNITSPSAAQKFLNPEELLAAIPLAPGMTVADFGCGNGYYSVAAAKIVGKTGQVYAFDILEDALSQTATLARQHRLQNLTTKQCDLAKPGVCEIPETSCDLAIVSSILHQMENKDNLLREAYRCLKTGGRILVVEWLPTSPLGPDLKSRVRPSAAQQMLERFSFRPAAELPAGSFHYALLYTK